MHHVRIAKLRTIRGFFPRARTAIHVPGAPAKELLNAIGLDIRCLEVRIGSQGALDFPLKIEPTEFLGYARGESRHDDRRSRINALSNAKRAIDAQVAKLLGACGVVPSRSDFSTRLDALVGLGLVGPTILRKVVRRRNLLEHEFEAPERPDVEDAVDVAALFIEATSRLLEYFPEEVVVSNARNEPFITPTGRETPWSRVCVFSFDSGQHSFEIRGGPDPGETISTTVGRDDPEYKSILRFVIAAERGTGAVDAFRSIVDGRALQSGALTTASTRP